MWTKTFDPEAFDEVKLDRIESARFITERARQLRQVALKSELVSVTWMVENVYYEAYAIGCTKQHEVIEPSAVRKLPA